MLLYYILYLIYIVLVAGTIFIVISENRNPIRSISWLLLLIFLPVVGLIFYYFFGQDTRKMKKMSSKYYQMIKELSFKDLLPDVRMDLSQGDVRLIKLLGKSNYSPLLQGSDVEVITTGERKFSALLDDLENAKHHIHMEYFIFHHDETGKQVRDMLIKKAKEGVEVRFLYDDVANWRVPDRFYKEMTKVGAEVTSFMKVKLPTFHSKVNYRNHRKVVIIDGLIAYTGGMNISNDYSTNPKWRDTHLRIKGQGVLGLQAGFLIDWHSSGKDRLDAPTSYFPVQPVFNSSLMQIVNDGPDNFYRVICQATIHIIATANDYVYIQTPYFLPTDSLFQALESAALSGVDIRLMVSRCSDSPYVDPAAQSYYEELLKSGVRIYEMNDCFVHAKTIVSDDMTSVIGSANFDFRSFESNFEVNTYIYDPDVAKRNREIFFKDMERCVEIDYEEWKSRPKWKRALESVLRLFAPLM